MSTDISYDDVQVGDRVLVTESGPPGVDYLHTYEITVDEILFAERADGMQSTTRRGIRADSAGTFLRGRWTTLTLLDRPVKRGPAWEAAELTLWKAPGISGPEVNVWIRATGTGPVFINTYTGERASYTELIDSLVPFQPPSVDAELERLRRNIIDAALSVLGNPTVIDVAAADGLVVAVRALRDYEATP